MFFRVRSIYQLYKFIHNQDFIQVNIIYLIAKNRIYCKYSQLKV